VLFNYCPADSDRSAQNKDKVYGREYMKKGGGATAPPPPPPRHILDQNLQSLCFSAINVRASYML